MKLILLTLLLSLALNAAKGNVGSSLSVVKSKAFSHEEKNYNVVAAASKSKPHHHKIGGDATIPVSIFNLAKSIIGAGVLSLPSGVAFFSDSPVALVPATIVCATMGVLAAYSFSLIGRACEKHQSRSFQDAWAKSVDPKTAWLISAGITAKCLLASLAYSIIIGDTFAALAKTFKFKKFFSNRSNIILLITSTILLPLCSLQSLSALAPFSLLGLGGTLYTAVFMAIRLFEGSYAVGKAVPPPATMFSSFFSQESVVAGGKYFAQMAVKPSFNKNPFNIFSSKVFVLISMLSTSFIAHYNAPKFFEELRNPTMKRFNQVVGGGFGIAIFTNIFIMCVGFMTFGGSSLGLVLNNYSGKDNLATFARVAVGAALLTGYPFTFSALREGILDLMHYKGNARKQATMPLTIISLAAITAGAITLRDVGFVVSLSGALFGCLLMFVVPALMNIANLKAKAVESKDKHLTSALSARDKVEIKLNYALIVLGLALTVIGTAITVNRQLSH